MERKYRNHWDRKEVIQCYLMAAGSVIGMIVFVVIPLIWIMRWCLFSYKGYGAVRFVGLDNFVRVFMRSDKYWLAVKNTFVFAFGKLLVEIPLALVLAFILTRRLKGRDFFRSVFFMPSMLSVAVIGVVFTYLFNHNQGVVNSAIKLMGGQGVKWFSDGTTAMIMLMIVSIWQNFGINMLFFMTGLQSIPPELYEAAAIDGANAIQKLISITIPNMKSCFALLFVTGMINGLARFTDIFILGGMDCYGGAGGTLQTILMYVYQYSFETPNYGIASAGAMVLFVLVFIMTMVNVKLTGFLKDEV